MDIMALKEAFDRILMQICMMSLATFSLLFLFLKVKFFSKSIYEHAKRHSWSVVVLLFIWSAWATYTAFPTSEEKEEYRKAQREQDAINKAWGDALLGNVANVGMLPIANANSQLNNEKCEGGNSEVETGNIVNGNTTILATSLTQDDFARGFVLTRIGTNEVHDFSAPSNAVVCADWLKDGAAEDWIYLAIED